MKKSMLFLLLTVLVGCSSSRQGINEKNIEDFSFDSQTSVEQKDSIATEIINETSDNQAEAQPQKDFTIPTYNFSTIPSDRYDISKNNDLLLTIVGKGNADISLSWQDNSGNWKTVKNGSKSEDIYTLKYSSEFVKKNIGTGEKRIIAEILFDEDREPLMLETVLNIVESVKPAKSTQKKSENFDLDITSNIVFDDIYFDYKKWKIPSYKYNTNFTLTINKVVKALKLDPKVNVILTGYTDKVGSYAYNQILAKKRCYTVSQLILNNFSDREKAVYRSRIFINPAGERDPIFTNAENSQVSRRVSLNLSYKKRGIELADFDINNVEKVQHSSVNIEEKYKQAVKGFYDKNFSDAQRDFEEIFEKYPGHSLADNAKWWYAEIFYVKKDFNTAIKNYNQVFGLGDGNKEAYAQYRIGCCHRELGNLKEARTVLENVKKLYPDATEEWQKAKQILVNLP